jgi:hypothetical protein
MEDDDTPPTQPSGFLVPPTKIPITALAVATPPPPREPRRARVDRSRLSLPGFFAEMLFNALDDVADAVAVGLRLRHR